MILTTNISLVTKVINKLSKNNCDRKKAVVKTKGLQQMLQWKRINSQELQEMRGDKWTSEGAY